VTSQSPDSLLAKRDPPSREALPSEHRPPAEEPGDATEETASPIEYPSKPVEYTDQSVETFVESHERAYRRNEALASEGGSLVSTSLDVDWTVTLDANGDAGIGRCKYRYETELKSGDGYAEGSSHGYLFTTYYVDESMIVRAITRDAGFGSLELDPDPWRSGVILESAE